MSDTPSTATKIMMIRHAEKPSVPPPPQGVDIDGNPDAESLIPQGWQRAGALVPFFAPAIGPFQNAKIATPQVVFASEVAKHSESLRPQETITPLVTKLGISPNLTFPKGQEMEVAEAARTSTGVVLICWEHENIPNIVMYIPISPNNLTPVPKSWPSGRFDVVWVFDQDATGDYVFTQVPQLLLAGDGP